MLPIVSFCFAGFLNTVVALVVLLAGGSSSRRDLPSLGMGRVLAAAAAVATATALEAALRRQAPPIRFLCPPEVSLLTLQ